MEVGCGTGEWVLLWHRFSPGPHRTVGGRIKAGGPAGLAIVAGAEEMGAVEAGAREVDAAQVSVGEIDVIEKRVFQVLAAQVPAAQREPAPDAGSELTGRVHLGHQRAAALAAGPLARLQPTNVAN